MWEVPKAAGKGGGGEKEGVAGGNTIGIDRDQTNTPLLSTHYYMHEINTMLLYLYKLMC